MQQNILDVVKLSDYMMRVYVRVGDQIKSKKLNGKSTEERPDGLNGPNGLNRPNGPNDRTINDSRLTFNAVGPPVYLYVGYYQSQRTGATYHSPKNCLPGAGWQLVDSKQMILPVQGRSPITINKVLIEKGLDKQLILYWYHDRGRVIASEYWAKAYLIWDAMTRNRTDGALVRISVPVTTTPERAHEQGLVFLQDVWPLLSIYMPAA